MCQTATACATTNVRAKLCATYIFLFAFGSSFVITFLVFSFLLYLNLKKNHGIHPYLNINHKMDLQGDSVIGVHLVCWILGFACIRASVDALCRDGPGEISRDHLQRGRLTRQGTTSLASKAHRYDSQTHL